MRAALVILSFLSLTEAFVAPKQAFVASPAIATSFSTAPATTALFAAAEPEYNSNEEMKGLSMENLSSVATSTAAFWSLTTTMASAAGPDWGIFEGRTLSLLHPVVMIGMLGLSVSTAILGFNWRRQRTIGDEIKDIKKKLPDLGSATTVQEAIKAAKAEESVDMALVSKLEAALPIQAEVDALTAERKELSKGDNRDKHFSQGATLAFLGTAFAIEGPLNTYARAGKLFPGPHLYAGAGLVVLWALAVAQVPAMQKGSDTARTIHIGANLAGVGLFVWQVVSGVPILLKVLEFTKWP